jgi:hypothetical protein
MTGWLLVLVLFLWVTGGAGWINFYEVMEDTEFNSLGKTAVLLTWPLMAVVAAVSQVRDAVVGLARGRG